MNIAEQEQLLRFLPKKIDLDKIIQEGTLNKDVKKTLQDCLHHCLIASTVDNNKIFEIESVIDYLHDELNTGHWSEVPLPTRQHFTCASFVKCIILLKSAELAEKILKDCLKSLDMGLLLGAPLDENEILPKAATYLSQILDKLQTTNTPIDVAHSNSDGSAYGEYFDSFKLIEAQNVYAEDCPTMECFNKNYFIPQVPVKLKGTESCSVIKY